MFQKLLGLPINASAHGGQIDELIGWVHVLMAVLFVGWGLLFAYMLIRFRKSRNPRADHEGVKTHASSYVEAVILLLEIVLLCAFSIPLWAKKVNAFPTEAEKPIHIRVIAQQFAWNIQYPGADGKFGKLKPELVTDDNPIGLDRHGDGKDDIVTINQLHVPVNRPVVIDITTKDVIHSFSLPMFRVKQDTIPGMMIPIHFTPILTTDEIRQGMVEDIALPPRDRNIGLYVALQDYKDKDGALIIKQGALLNDTLVPKLLAAGINTVHVAPSNPTEIACAQLCGANHYQMKGYMTVHTQADYDKWMAAQVDNLSDE